MTLFCSICYLFLYLSLQGLKSLLLSLGFLCCNSHLQLCCLLLSSLLLVCSQEALSFLVAQLLCCPLNSRCIEGIRQGTTISSSSSFPCQLPCSYELVATCSFSSLFLSFPFQLQLGVSSVAPSCSSCSSLFLQLGVPSLIEGVITHFP